MAADPHGKEEGVKQQKGLPLPNRLVLYLQLRNNVDPSIRHDQSRETPPASVDPLPEPQTLVQIQFHTPLREHHFTPETGRGRHSAPDPHPGARRGQMTRSACIRVRPGLTGLTYPMRRSHLDQFLQICQTAKREGSFKEGLGMNECSDDVFGCIRTSQCTFVQTVIIGPCQTCRGSPRRQESSCKNPWG